MFLRTKGSASSLQRVTTYLRSSELSFASKKEHDHHDQPKHKAKVEVKKTKYNPEGELDLRGYQSFDSLGTDSVHFTNIHSKVYQRNSSYWLFSLLPNRLAKSIGRVFQNPISTIASDTLYLPRIGQNSIPLYDSLDKSHSYMVANKVMTQLLPVTLPFLHNFTTTLLLYGLGVYVYTLTGWRQARNLVIKAELSPQTEQIIYQKITLFGGISTSRVKIADLQAVTFSELFDENSSSERATRGLYNTEVAFRIKSTKELLFFDKNGIWNHEGVNHPLLV